MMNAPASTLQMCGVFVLRPRWRGRSTKRLCFQMLWITASFSLLYLWYFSTTRPLYTNLDRALRNDPHNYHNGTKRRLPTPLSVVATGSDVNQAEIHKSGAALIDSMMKEPPRIKLGSELVDIVRKKLHSLPIVYVKPSQNSTPDMFPSLWSIQFTNQYWQTLETSNGTLYLYGAYYDNRTLLHGNPVIRILGMMDKIEPSVKSYCQLWFDGLKGPILSKTLPYDYMWKILWGNYQNGPYQPYHISCPVPREYKQLVPVSVSLVENEKGIGTTNLNVFYTKPKNGERKKVAVCVKALIFLSGAVSVRLVEWIETLRHLGADKILFYSLAIHSNVRKVFEYYQNKGLVDFTDSSLAGYQTNFPEFYHLYLKEKRIQKRQNELIPYNDCFFKNMHLYEYISLLDIDEVILPMGRNMLWNDLINNLKLMYAINGTQETKSFCFRHVYFFDNQTAFSPNKSLEEIPPYMHMFQHVQRTRNHSEPKQFTKCFHNTLHTLTVHNHMPRACLTDKCDIEHVDEREAQMHHYRTHCTAAHTNCDSLKKDIITDDVIRRHINPVVQRTKEALADLGFLE